MSNVACAVPAGHSVGEWRAPINGAGGVPAARAGVARFLRVWGLGQLAADGEMVAGELAANACLHGAPPVEVTVWAGDTPGGPVVTIEVCDAGPGEPVILPCGPGAEHGRGLHIVAALAAWGVRAEACGKTVWAQLTVPTSEPGRAEAEAFAIIHGGQVPIAREQRAEARAVTSAVLALAGAVAG